ncbi:MAG: ATP-binding cassette domain-containing protein [Gemmatimonadetes bacterium]|nr:ATP-binding cassette domain-containing protein [Gemmatimonadota bacterium]
MSLISLGGVGVEFGATEIFRDITVTIAPGDRWAVVGRNGTGKTTLVKLLTGALAPSRGSVARMPGLRIALMDQHRTFPDGMSLWEVVADAFGDLRRLERSLAEQAANLEHDHAEAAMERYGRDLERFEREGGYQMAARVDAVLMGVGFDPEAARATAIGTLSGGERGRVALARQLATPADLLVLDEPTNHLDLATTAWLEQHLRESDRTVLCISHDRAFLDAMADHVLHFEGGTAFAYAGGYASFVVQREERRLTQQRQFDQQQRKIAAEQDYIARNIAGQNTAQAQGRRKRLERMPRLSAPIGADAVMALRLDAGTRSGDRVIEARAATVGVPPHEGQRDGDRGDWRVLVRDVTVVLDRGETVALVGPNGAGKSTLIKTLLGEHPPLAGEVRVGPSTTVAYYRQDLRHLPLELAIYDAIADQRPLWERRMVQGHLGRFGFSGDEVQRTIGTLSGGERARVAMALLTLSTNNLLILDEPTNHLDVESIEALEDAIEGYEGSVLLVSHDRAVLRGLATQVWELRDGALHVFPGSFVEWEAWRAEHAARAAAQAEGDRQARARANEKAREKARDRERERDASAGGGDRKAAVKRARKALQEAEARVQLLEAEVAALTARLDDGTLYDTPAGVEKAARWGRELDEAREALDAAMADWAAAGETLERLEG